MGQTVIEKIAARHQVEGGGAEVRAGQMLTVRPAHVMTHDNTAAVLKKFRGIGAARVHDPAQPIFTLDHDIQNRSEKNLAKYAAIEAFAAEQGITFYPAGSGIGHQMMLDQGHVLPGAFVVASDSHSNMYGAVGALGTPVVRTDAAAIWATGEFWWQVPPTVRVTLRGALRPGVSGKDVIITLCGMYNTGEVLNAAVEFGGEGVATLSMDARMTISNMTTEWGALAGWFPVDDVTLGYLQDRRAAGVSSISEQDLRRWEAEPPAADADAAYAAEIELDLGEVSPHISGPDTVQVMTALAEFERRELPIDKAYLLSCVNSRYEDLAAAAAVLRGKKVAERVTLYVAAASREIQQRAERDGLWQVFDDAGARFLPPGCGPCIGLGEGLLEPGEVGISATNRNFKGRMGSREARCYLASPEVVAASAIAGRVRGPHAGEGGVPERRYRRLALVRESAAVEILEGFPAEVRGRLLHLPQDNLNTDGIYGKDYTYREDVSREEMARVVMENYDPAFSATAKEGDILAGGFNFGTGSSREQAVTALQARGIALIVAGSYSQTYLRNAYNNGLICIVQPELARELAQQHAPRVEAGERTIVCDGEALIDFRRGVIEWNGRSYDFDPLGSVAQQLVVAGGVENLVRSRLGL